LLTVLIARADKAGGDRRRGERAAPGRAWAPRPPAGARRARATGRQGLNRDPRRRARVPVSYVLINSEHGSDESVIEALKGALEGEAGLEYEMQGVYGVYDIVLRLASDDAARLRSIITNKVRRIGRVQSTLTMMVIEEQGA